MTRCARWPSARGIRLIADACHAPGATYKGRNAGTLADISCFSFHPVKHLTTCEGGMARDRRCARWPRICAASAITASTATIARARPAGAHAYDMAELGYNYRLPDVQCALGLAQLKRLAGWVAARQKIAALYDEALAGMAQVRPLKTHDDRTHAYHLYVVRLADGIDRDRVFARLRAEGIGANVHYAPVYLHSHYRKLGYSGPGPMAEAVAARFSPCPCSRR